MQIDRPMREFLDGLSAKKPTPGGGSVAALAGVLGTSLMSMVGNYTIGNKHYIKDEQRVATILLKLEKLSGDFAVLVDRDIDSYAKLSESIKAHKDNSAATQMAYTTAVEPPIETCSKAHEALALCGELIDIGNKNLITDTAIAAMMLVAAFYSSKFNVMINMRSIKDNTLKMTTMQAIQKQQADIDRMKNEILKKIDIALEV